MDRGEHYPFYFPSRDTDDIADINLISANFRIIDGELYSINKNVGDLSQLKTKDKTNIVAAINEAASCVGGIAEKYANQTYSNAIKGVASGSGVVKLDSVSPLEHELDVRLTTEDGAGVEGAILYQYGKNLCDYTKFKPYSGGTITLVENGFTFTGRYYCSLDGSFLPLGRYYMSWKFESESSITPVWRLQYQDGTFSSQIQNGAGITITKPVKNVLLYHDMAGGTHTATFTDIQLEIGTSATQYEPYQRTEHTADADGIVKGVKSISPVTTLIADAGVAITAEYNKDSTAVIEGLMERIVALEAAIVNN